MKFSDSLHSKHLCQSEEAMHLKQPALKLIFLSPDI